MNGWVIDTNIISELRKGPRADSNVRNWFLGHDNGDLYISVLTLGEIRKGIEKKRKTDPTYAFELELWLYQIESDFSDRILPIDRKCADIWGLISSHDPLPVADALIASTALEHGLTVVTRNEKDFTRLNVPMVNPFS